MDYSFYGGKQGTSFNIEKTYSSIAEMQQDFAKGASCSVTYGGYVMVVNEDENISILYRRGFNYSGTDNGAEYISSLTGAKGDNGKSPVVVFTDYDEVSEQQQDASYNEYAPDTVPGKTENGFNDHALINSFTGMIGDEYLTQVGIKTVAPSFDFDVTPKAVTAEDRDSFVSNVTKTDDGLHPYYHKYNIELPVYQFEAINNAHWNDEEHSLKIQYNTGKVDSEGNSLYGEMSIQIPVNASNLSYDDETGELSTIGQKPEYVPIYWCDVNNQYKPYTFNQYFIENMIEKNTYDKSYNSVIAMSNDIDNIEQNQYILVSADGVYTIYQKDESSSIDDIIGLKKIGHTTRNTITPLYFCVDDSNYREHTGEYKTLDDDGYADETDYSVFYYQITPPVDGKETASYGVVDNIVNISNDAVLYTVIGNIEFIKVGVIPNAYYDSIVESPESLESGKTLTFTRKDGQETKVIQLPIQTVINDNNSISVGEKTIDIATINKDTNSITIGQDEVEVPVPSYSTGDATTTKKTLTIGSQFNCSFDEGSLVQEDSVDFYKIFNPTNNKVTDEVLNNNSFGFLLEDVDDFESMLYSVPVTAHLFTYNVENFSDVSTWKFIETVELEPKQVALLNNSRKTITAPFESSVDDYTKYDVNNNTAITIGENEYNCLDTLIVNNKNINDKEFSWVYIKGIDFPYTHNLLFNVAFNGETYGDGEVLKVKKSDILLPSNDVLKSWFDEDVKTLISNKFAAEIAKIAEDETLTQEQKYEMMLNASNTLSINCNIVKSNSVDSIYSDSRMLNYNSNTDEENIYNHTIELTIPENSGLLDNMNLELKFGTKTIMLSDIKYKGGNVIFDTDDISSNLLDFIANHLSLILTPTNTEDGDIIYLVSIPADENIGNALTATIQKSAGTISGNWVIDTVEMSETSNNVMSIVFNEYISE